ncbi:MAG: tetratricopeptide repeat protein, partial [Chitinophagaceae bacterium]
AATKKISETNKQFKLAEDDVNTWGYKLLRQNRLPDALEVFKLNVYLYPESANAFDSLGEMYAELGEIKLAITNYERSLKLDPENSNAEVQLKKLRSLAR